MTWYSRQESFMSRNERFSTTNQTSHVFKPHGRIDSEVVGNIFVQEATGPFNKEIFAAMRSVHASAKEQLPSVGNWYGLFIFRNSALAPQEMLDDLYEYLKDQKHQNRASRATAIVLPEVVEAASLMKPLYLRVWRKAGITCEAFTDEQLARAWLDSVLKSPID
ncbi:hypothetical protein [Rhodoferax mekongensis]|uniref:hypothetical protein n=1 Tax=Rhodoferax mekongensis TaxID=3068341 RepID=UPI0028BF4352|nr:hypothetical protein [Rhodoferax sp. TBRC 17199]MDT7517064.1 hypothetical protein [Rhodoferax sp. TBRC 17199]